MVASTVLSRVTYSMASTLATALRRLHHQTAAAVDFVFKTLDPARSRVRDDHIGLALAEGTHGKHLASRADILVDAFAARIFPKFY